MRLLDGSYAPGGVFAEASTAPLFSLAADGSAASLTSFPPSTGGELVPPSRRANADARAAPAIFFVLSLLSNACNGHVTVM